MFWSENMFYLPRGSLSHTKSHFDKIPPKHKALTKNIGIQFSLLDLTEDVIAAVEYSPEYQASKYDIDQYWWATRFCLEALEHIWNAKLDWVRSWRGLQNVRLETLDYPPVVWHETGSG